MKGREKQRNKETINNYLMKERKNEITEMDEEYIRMKEKKGKKKHKKNYETK